MAMVFLFQPKTLIQKSYERRIYIPIVNERIPDNKGQEKQKWVVNFSLYVH